MTIKFSRTDDRFIHGQVTTGWIRQIGVNKIALVNNNIASNKMIMNLQTMSAGSGVEVEFYTLQQALDGIQKGNFCSDGDYFLLVENPVDLLQLVIAGLVIDKVNLGNLHFENGKQKITNWIFVNDAQLDALRKLDKSGIKLNAQWTVASDPVNINNWLSGN